MDMHSVLGIDLGPKLLTIPQEIFVSDSFVGVEVEVESRARVSLNYWREVSEGSISGYELVLAQPEYGIALYEAILELDSVATAVGPTAFGSRTSVHVHIDIRDMTVTQLMNFIALSVMFEPVLYKYVAPHRSANHFCWSMLESQEPLKRLASLYKTVRTATAERLRNKLATFTQSNCKYSGINLSSISRYGSLEFRMHEGTANSIAIIRWINILLSIKEYAMGENRTPNNILETKMDVGIDSIFHSVLGNYTGVLSYDTVETDILTGIRNAQDFIYDLVGDSPPRLPSVDPNIFLEYLRSLPTNVLTSTGARLIGTTVQEEALEEDFEDDEDEEDW